MKILVYKNGSIPQTVLETVSLLLHDAFEERRQVGLNIPCGMFSTQDVENKHISGGGYILIAYDEKDEAVGTNCLLEHRKGRYRYASCDYLAVLSSRKRSGVARCLFQEILKVARDEGYDFITITAATKAYSSVAYHLKMGCVIYQKCFGLVPGSYDSYAFIYPLKRFRFMRVKFLRAMFYASMTSLRRIKQFLHK